MNDRVGRAGIRHGWARVLLALWLSVVAFDACAGFRLLPIGKEPKLRAGEGLVMVVVDTDNPLLGARFKRVDDRVVTSPIAAFGNGVSVRLYAAPAGAYRWDTINGPLFAISYRMEKKDEAAFVVAPGKVTYPGDLIYRSPNGLITAQIRLSNRGSWAMDWLEDNFPQIWRDYEFVYSGHYPDPFPAQYRAARTQVGKARDLLDRIKVAPASPQLAVPIRELWRAERIDDITLNPRGDLVAKTIRGEEEWEAALVDLKTGVASPLMSGEERLSILGWAGDRVVVLGIHTGGGSVRLHVVRIEEDALGKRSLRAIESKRGFDWVDVLPEDPDHVLAGTYTYKDGLMVHRVPITEQKVLDRITLQRGNRINHGVKGDFAWFADGHGALRLALARRDDAVVMLHGRGDEFVEVAELDGAAVVEDSGFTPLTLSYDGNTIYGLTDEGREQRDLVEFDPITRRVSRTLFSKPGVDIELPLLDARRNVIGAAYRQNGHLISEYFDPANRRLSQYLGAAFPRHPAMVVQRSLDGSQALVWVGGSDKPADLYHLDAAAQRMTLLDHAQPWLTDRTFVASEVLAVKGNDGTPIEAYLTLPQRAGKRPLVVLTHGGPIGVRDNRYFDPEVQLLAGMGYAVLQVNFRGSDGYGKAFRESGDRAYGTLIEDDIDAATRHVLANYPIDATRMCAVGSSYGGYSSLVSAIRWPERFRCAVSISGVSDRVLFFTASDTGHTAKGRAALERHIGNPNAELDSMLATSPLYRYQDLKTPVLLVHGREDARVDFEHTRRLLRMLNLAGRMPYAIELEDEGHGFRSLDTVERVWSGVAGFLDRYLGESPPSNVAETAPAKANAGAGQ